MIVGTLLVESFDYGVQDVELPLFDNGLPLMDGATGKQKLGKFKLLRLEVLPGLFIEIRVREEQWADFVADLSGKRVAVAPAEALDRLGPAALIR